MPITVEPLYKGTPKSYTTLNNKPHFGVKVVSTTENNLQK